jgi:hypothetical protein
LISRSLKRWQKRLAKAKLLCRTAPTPDAQAELEFSLRNLEGLKEVAKARDLRRKDIQARKNLKK